MWNELAMPILGGWLVSFLLFVALWLVQVVRKDAGVVDIGWTAGVGIMAVLLAVAGQGWAPRRIMIAVLAGGWALRLCYYILVDRVLPSGEDRRYQRLRAYWGKRANILFFFFFTAQSVLVLLFALPFLPAVHAPDTGFGIWDFSGMGLWCVALAGEVRADRQLSRFRRNPANRGITCKSGLWRYSRHPNYFFEWLHWWSYVLIAVPLINGWLALAGPFLMFLFLRYLTGIPHTEKQALSSRSDYAEYIRTTRMFLPIPKWGRDDDQ